MSSLSTNSTNSTNHLNRLKVIGFVSLVGITLSVIPKLNQFVLEYKTSLFALTATLAFFYRLSGFFRLWVCKTLCLKSLMLYERLKKVESDERISGVVRNCKLYFKRELEGETLFDKECNANSLALYVSLILAWLLLHWNSKIIMVFDEYQMMFYPGFMVLGLMVLSIAGIYANLFMVKIFLINYFNVARNPNVIRLLVK